MIDLKTELPESFLNEETRWGFTVPKNLKEIWAVELDLLAELDRVCRAHDLRFVAGAGTLLGAVRHHGFIPWDDDMDVYMLRPDYDRLMALTDEFKEPYFLQNTNTDPNLFRAHAQLRNSATTGFIEKDRMREINKGLFIDIFPIDGISPNAEEDAAQKAEHERLEKLLRRYMWCMEKRPRSLTEKLKRMVYMGYYKKHPKGELFAAYDANLKRYSVPGTAMWGNRTLVFDCPKSRRPYEEWTEIVMLPFEFTEIPAPAAWDAMLTQQYGNYMKLPEKLGENFHGGLTVSTDVSYRDYQY